MTFAGTAALGAVAGFTILLGLPIGRLRRPRPALIAFLNAAAIGVLLFLFYDVLKNAGETITTALDEDRRRGIGYALLLALGLAVGLLSLVVFERFGLRRQKRPLPSGPGALAADTVLAATTAVRREPLAPAFRVALFIAVGIGLHNFSEGLAIGQSAATGAYQLLFVLVIGFGLHNMTEGFGITAPLIGKRPSWGFLALCGVIGGGPTLLGTLVGYHFTSGPLSVLFLALAAGAIIYVVGELQHAGRKIGSHDIAMVGLLVGFLAGYATDLLLHTAGG
ncbi:MAG TPA: ZIP family metal transporter [Candidatus Dormibacteraeota bacterium]